MSEDRIEFFVAGVPQAKGSTRAFIIKGKAITTSSNRNLKQWELRVAHEAQMAQEAREKPFYEDNKRQPYLVNAEFYFTRPKNLPKKVLAKTTRPDIDKLLRSVLDGITSVLLPDDALVTGVGVYKGFASESQPPGAKILVVKMSTKPEFMPTMFEIDNRE